MSRRFRVTAVLAAVGAGVLLLSAAVPAPNPALFTQSQSSVGATNVSTSPITVPPRPPSEPPAGSLPAEAAVNDLRALAKDGSAELDSSGTIRSITAAPGKNLGTDAGAFLSRYAAAFGLSKGHTLDQVSTDVLPGGDSVTRYQQKIDGLPVLGGQIVLTSSGEQVRSALTDASYLVPKTGQQISAAAAGERAMAAAAARGLATAGLSASSTLWLYGANELRPTYWVKLSQANADHEEATILVDALDGSIKVVAPKHQSADSPKRRVCDQGNVRLNLSYLGQYLCTSASSLGLQSTSRAEGGAASSSAEVNAVYDKIGVVYNWYLSNFGLNSFNGRGAEIRANVNACDIVGSCGMPNAFWDSAQLTFGAGWATDDVVAHEFTHAVTEHSSNLYYWKESGALNEALSDIFGEFIDLATAGDGTDDTNKRWQLGESIAGVGAIRNMLTPSIYGDPDTVYGSGWWYADTDAGGVHTNSGPANRLAALLYDGSPGNGVTALGAQKSAQLWYRVQHLLPSGASYQDLGYAMKSACREMLGKLTTAADCDSILAALSVIGVTNYPQADPVCVYGAYTGWGSKPSATQFSDDMESDLKWNFSDSYNWLRVPALDVPYSYATSGTKSLNGWGAGVGTSGTGTYAEMKNYVAIPAAASGVSSWISFNESNRVSGGWSTGVKYLINDGTGWQNLMTQQGGSSFSSTNGYRYNYANVSAFAGKSVKVRFELSREDGRFVDWYLDDFKIHSCNTEMPGAPLNAYAYKENDTLKVTWDSFTYLADTSTPANGHFELSYDPPIPGAPTTYRPDVSQSNDPRRTITITGVDLTKNYKITIRLKRDTGSALAGPWTTVLWSPGAPVSCPRGLITFLPSPTGKCEHETAVARVP